MSQNKAPFRNDYRQQGIRNKCKNDDIINNHNINYITTVVSNAMKIAFSSTQLYAMVRVQHITVFFYFCYDGRSTVQ